jgi:hypothetical protein
MDTTMIGIFIGFILTGMIAGFVIGQAYEHRRLFNYREARRSEWPTVFSKDEVERVLAARKEVR